MLKTRSQRQPATSLRRKRPHVTDALDVVARGSQGLLERGNRRGGIELGDLVLGEAQRQIVVLQIVGEPDPHLHVSL